ncbi:preprotein translocase subunit SecG, partial [Candidatus Nomurabacteria bacterium]|nr:preprotein translocase subunit SecG [Candidatus Nomurabacteria bacterium]
MLSVLSAVIYASVVLIAVLLIVLVLVQPSKGGGFGSAFGGVGEAVFGGRAGNHLTKMTVILTTLFFVLM